MDEKLTGSWGPLDAGASIGTVGSEGGLIILDEEHPHARITIERECAWAPFAITCGVYGLMAHTRYLGTEAQARAECEAMKQALVELIAVVERGAGAAELGAACGRFVERFP